MCVKLATVHRPQHNIIRHPTERVDDRMDIVEHGSRRDAAENHLAYLPTDLSNFRARRTRIELTLAFPKSCDTTRLPCSLKRMTGSTSSTE